MRAFNTLCTGFVLLLVAFPALAGDGAIEINAACVADGCFAGDDPGFPVQINNAGSYVLTSNLEVGDANTTAIDISKANVSLDLNGFSLIGPTSCTGRPVTSCSPTGNGRGIETYNGNRISNGAVVGFGSHGIYALAHSRLQNLRVEFNGGDGIYAQAGTAVNNVEAVRNGAAGVEAFTSQSMLELTNSLLKENGEAGARTTAGVVLNNRFHNNGDYGLVATSTSDNAVGYAGNVFFGNFDDTVNRQVQGGYPTGCNLVVDTMDCPTP